MNRLSEIIALATARSDVAGRALRLLGFLLAAGFAVTIAFGA